MVDAASINVMLSERVWYQYEYFVHTVNKCADVYFLSNALVSLKEP